MRAVIAFTALVATGAPGFAVTDNHKWATYTNERFGFSVCYPSDLVRPGRPPDNNDGLAFVGSDGARIIASGMWNAVNWTLGDSAREAEKRLANDNGKITYKFIGKDFYIISGRSGNQIFYNRTALVKDKFSELELTYPAADSTLWNAITERVSQCFKPGQ